MKENYHVLTLICEEHRGKKRKQCNKKAVFVGENLGDCEWQSKAAGWASGKEFGYDWQSCRKCSIRRLKRDSSIG